MTRVVNAAQRLQRRARDERGVVLVLVAMLMVVFIGMGALAIDVGSFYQAQRQAQAAADAAALAGAKDLPSQSTATATATTYAGKNMSGVPASCNVNLPGVCVTFPSSSQVKVVVSTTTPSFLGRIFGITSATVSASAVAAQTTGLNPCTTAGSGCYAFFALDSVCTPSTHYAIQFPSGNDTVTGGILSNGSIYFGGGNSAFGPTTYGPTASGCRATLAAGNDTWASGPTSEASIVTAYPINYATDFPSCTGAACTGPLGTPSFCTSASTSTAWSLTPTSGNIYCDVGSGMVAQPTTWNGALSLTTNGSSGAPVAASYVAGSVGISSGNGYLEACGYTASGYAAANCSAAVPAPTAVNASNYPLIYALSTSATAVSGGGGGSTFLGDMFAPNGTIAFSGGGSTTSFLEANDVIYTGGGLTADGPSDSGGGLPSTGSVSLVG